MTVRVRIAPSPTGKPHIGTAYTSLFNFIYAKKNGGDFILRIEDTDRSRFVEGAEKDIIESLKWLGLEWKEGPDIGGPFAPYRQSERLEIYEKFVGNLVAENKAYRCDCSPERLKEVRDDQQRKGFPTHYDKKCRGLNVKKSSNTVVRLAVPEEGETTFRDEVRGEITFNNKDIDDQVLMKSDGFPTYHLASVVDDNSMEITHVIRAEEWLTSTPKHVILYKAFGWDLPKFIHLPLLRNPDKSKISKRKNPVSINWYKEQGYLPSAFLNYLATMGWSMPDGKEIFSLEELINNFSIKRIDPAGPVFDVRKLDWMNGEHIRKLDNKELVERLAEFTKVKKEDITRITPLVKDRMKKLSEFDSLTSYFFEENVEIEEKLIIQKGRDKESTKKVLQEVCNLLIKLEDWNKDNLERALGTKNDELEWTKKDLFQTIRATITGLIASPPLFETLEAIGRTKTLSRFEKAINLLSN